MERRLLYSLSRQEDSFWKKKAKALYNLSYCQIMQGDYEKAKENLRAALSYDLDNKAIKENLSMA